MQKPVNKNPFVSDTPYSTVKAMRSVYVVYAAIDGMWVLAGFVRRRLIVRRTRTMSQRFAVIRQKLGIHKDTIVTAVDLLTAQHNISEIGCGVSGRVPA
jgi:hypothetical protein